MVRTLENNFFFSLMIPREKVYYQNLLPFFLLFHFLIILAKLRSNGNAVFKKIAESEKQCWEHKECRRERAGLSESSNRIGE